MHTYTHTHTYTHMHTHTYIYIYVCICIHLAGRYTRSVFKWNVASNTEQVLAATPHMHQLCGHLPSITNTQDTAGEARTNSSVIYSYGHSHMSKQKQDDQLEHTYSSYVRIRDVALKTWQKRWMIGRSGERGSGISVLAARHDDDNDFSFIGCHTKDSIYIYIYIYIYILTWL